jgi:hypothetical protein
LHLTLIGGKKITAIKMRCRKIPATECHEAQTPDTALFSQDGAA